MTEIHIEPPMTVETTPLRPRRARPQLAALGWLVAALAIAGCSGDGGSAPEAGAAGPRHDVVIVTWDTARADRVGPDSVVPGTTPGLDALAAEGVRFTQARSPVPTTLPAHSSLLTGQDPPRHGVRANSRFSLPLHADSVAELARGAGWATGGFVSAAVLDASTGIAQGFEHFDARVGASDSRYVGERPAAVTVDVALSWAQALPAERSMFLWVHLFDPHAPLQAPEPHASRFAEDPYAAEIAYSDAETARLLDGLHALGRRDDALVFVTSDHGEGLGEHGELTHAWFAYDSTLRIPLVAWAGPDSGTTWPPRVVDVPVSLSDVAPTLAEAFGWPLPAADGRSLAATLAGGPLSPREFAFECAESTWPFGTAPIFGVLDAQRRTWFDLPRRELYDLAIDPGQLDNRYTDAHAAEADALFARHPRAWPPQEQETMDPARIEQLEALGYVGAGVATSAVEPNYPVGRDPKELVSICEFLHEPPTSVPEQGVARADELIQQFGPLPALVAWKADVLVLGVSRQAAIELLLEQTAGDPSGWLARDLESLQAAERSDRQLAERIRAALAADPEHPDARFDLALVLHRLGELEEAEALYRQALDAKPGDAEARVALSKLLVGQGRLDPAEALLRAGPDGVADPALACALGRLLFWRQDRPTEALPHLAACRAGGGELLDPEEAALARAEP